MTTRMAAVTTSWIAILGTIVLSWVGGALWGMGDWLMTAGDPDESFRSFLREYLIGGVIWLMTYGLLFSIPLALTIVLLDLSFFGKSVEEEDLRPLLMAEWGVIALPLSVLAVTNSSPVIIIPIVALLIAQLSRENPIRRILAPRTIIRARSG